MSATAKYLKTLRRIPDDIVLSVATREIVDISPSQCVCGWAIRESIARAANMPAEEVIVTFPVTWRCENAFGGTDEEWSAIFLGICDEAQAPRIEAAFVIRVMEAAGVAP